MGLSPGLPGPRPLPQSLLPPHPAGNTPHSSPTSRLSISAGPVMPSPSPRGAPTHPKPPRAPVTQEPRGEAQDSCGWRSGGCQPPGPGVTRSPGKRPDVAGKGVAWASQVQGVLRSPGPVELAVSCALGLGQLPASRTGSWTGQCCPSWGQKGETEGPREPGPLQSGLMALVLQDLGAWCHLCPLASPRTLHLLQTHQPSLSSGALRTLSPQLCSQRPCCVVSALPQDLCTCPHPSPNSSPPRYL